MRTILKLEHVVVKYSAEWNEYQVFIYSNEDATYYTNCKLDAIATAKAINNDIEKDLEKFKQCVDNTEYDVWL